MEFGLCRVLAVIGLSPQQLSQKTGLVFETAKEDGVGYVLAALAVTNEGKQFALRQYAASKRTNPDKTELIGSENSLDPIADLRSFLNILKLRPNYLTWYPSLFEGRYSQEKVDIQSPPAGILIAKVILPETVIAELTGLVFQDFLNDSLKRRAAVIRIGASTFLLNCKQTQLSSICEVSSFNETDKAAALSSFLSATKIPSEHVIIP